MDRDNHTQQSNLTPQQAKNTLINYMWHRSRLTNAGLLCAFRTFSQNSKLELAVYSIRTEEYNFSLAYHFCWMHREKTISMKEDLIDTFVLSTIHESSNGAAKHI